MIRRVASGAPCEPVVGYSRAVAALSRRQEYGRAYGTAPADMPTSIVEVQAVIDPRMPVEVEAVAYRPGMGSP